MPFEWIVAVRFLREGRVQSLLILSGVAVGVGVIIFLSALINGLQTSLIDKTLGTQAHIVVRPPDEIPRPMLKEPGLQVSSRIEKPAQRLRSILRWQQILESIQQIPGVTAIAAVVSGPAFAVRGAAGKSVTLRGIERDSFLRIIDVESKMLTGRFRIIGNETVIGAELASDLGIMLGEKLRISTAEGRSDVYTVTGIFDLGNRDINQRWVFVSLRAAQTLLDLVGGVSAIEVKVAEIFEAETAAGRIAARTNLVADSWMKMNTQLLVGLRSQNSSSYMIQVFVVIAVALGISSVLVVSVVQKSREIGILKAMGAPTARVTRVFLIQGGLVGLVGSLIGVLIGIGLSLFFQMLARNPDGSPTFPVDLNVILFVRTAAIATFTGVASAVVPARRAAKLDPAEVIRYG
jgi:lipoprotein-releasing system permease protein